MQAFLRWNGEHEELETMARAWFTTLAQEFSRRQVKSLAVGVLQDGQAAADLILRLAPGKVACSP